MSVTKTDRNQAIKSGEYVWDVADESEVHGFVWPCLQNKLMNGHYQALLDIGCGNGALTEKLAVIVPKCVGIDFSKSGIEIAEARSRLAAYEVAQVDEPLPEHLHKKFDIVVAVEVIEHLLLPRRLFVRAKEALKPDGYLIVTTPYHGYIKNLALAVAGRWDTHCHPLRDFGHVKFFSEDSLGSLFREQGFKVDFFHRVGRIPVLARSMIMGGSMLDDRSGVK